MCCSKSELKQVFLRGEYNMLILKPMMTPDISQTVDKNNSKMNSKY